MPGEIVRVNSNLDTVKRIQDETIGWHELMAKVSRFEYVNIPYTDNPLYTDTLYNDTIRYNGN